MTRLEIGENRAPRFGVPTWAGEWPVTIDGSEVALILETERGYRLRQGGRWLYPERSCRSTAEDDARNVFLSWATQASHVWSGTRYQETECNGQTWSRVTVNGAVAFGPERGTERAYAEYNRRYAKSTEGVNGK
jgi:hypothetical protein